MEQRLTDLEETTAHLTREVEDLSAIVARQDSEIARLTRQVQLLMEREAQREAAEGAAVVMGDERPPHY
jgi:SlyX protein